MMRGARRRAVAGVPATVTAWLALAGVAFAGWAAAGLGSAAAGADAIVAPSDLTAGVVDQTVRLRWSPVRFTDGTTVGGVEVVRRTNNVDTVVAGGCSALNGDATGCSDTDVPYGNHEYRIRARHAAWSSDGAAVPVQVAIYPFATTPMSATDVIGDGPSMNPAISYDGRFVAFESAAESLGAGADGFSQVLLKNRADDSVTVASVSSAGTRGNGASLSPEISDSGTRVAFSSSASNLVAGDSQGFEDVFLRDLEASTTVRVSVATDGTVANGASRDPDISADGRYVAFDSMAANLDGLDTNQARDVFVHDLVAGTTEVISPATSALQFAGDSTQSSISGDGRYVAYTSLAMDIVAIDTNTVADVFVHDRQTGQTELVSIATSGFSGLGASENPEISADGRYVAFESSAENLVAGDTNLVRDIFVRDLVAGTTTLLSRSSSGAQSTGASTHADLAHNGRFVSFQSAGLLTPGDFTNAVDVFVVDRLASDTVTRFQVDSEMSAISGSGRYVASHTEAGLVPTDTQPHSDVHVTGWTRDPLGSCGHPGGAGCWSGDGDASDSLHRNHGTLEGGTLATVPGVRSTALRFDKVSRYVNVPFDESLTSEHVTIGAWVRPDGLNNPTESVLAGQAGGASLLLSVLTSADVNRPVFRIQTAAGPISLASNMSLPADVFSHVAATWDGTWMRMYVNGVAAGEAHHPAAEPTSTTQPVTLGGSVSGTRFDGRLDDVRYFSRALGAGEVVDLAVRPSSYDETRDVQDAASQLPMLMWVDAVTVDEEAGTGVATWRDGSGNGYDITADGGSTRQAELHYTEMAGAPALRFTGLPRYRAAFPSTDAQPTTYIIAYRRDSGHSYLFERTDGICCTQQAAWENASNVTTFAGQKTVNAPTPPINEVRLAVFVYDGQNSRIYLGGGSPVATGELISYARQSDLIIGGYPDLDGYNLNGAMGFFGIADVDLTSAAHKSSLNQLGASLAGRYSSSWTNIP